MSNKREYKEKHGQDFTEIIEVNSEISVRINHERKSEHFGDGTDEFGGMLMFDNKKRLIDYDGASQLPPLVAKMIRLIGYKVPHAMM